MDVGHDFSNYMRARAETREARERHNYAGAALELATIKERYFELLSQADPIGKLLEMEIANPRLKLWASAHYVVWGRLPDELKEQEMK